MKDVLKEARERWHEDSAADQHNRDQSLEDLKFYAGEQWPEVVRQQRLAQGRPMLTVNALPQYLRQIINDARMRPPSIKVRPADSMASKDVAETKTGLIRNIEAASQAEIAYIKALEHAVICGLGHFRIATEYTTDDVFELDIRIRPVMSPMSVTWDYGAIHPLKTDASHVFVDKLMTRRAFEEEYPDAVPTSWDTHAREYGEWTFGEWVRVAEYWYRKPIKRTLLQIVSGQQSAVIDAAKLSDEEMQFARFNGLIQRERKVDTHKVCMALLSGHELLSKEYEWASEHFPIIPVLGEEVNIGERNYRHGMVRNARDAQWMYNAYLSSIAETISMAPKSKWLATGDMVAGREEKWARMNQDASSVALYTPDPMAPGMKPEMVPPPPVPPALVTGLQIAGADMERTIGLYRANLGQESNETSGTAILNRQREGDVGTFAYIDNLRRAVEQCGRILVEMLPVIYDTPRIVRVLGEDGGEKLVPINQPMGNGNAYDLSRGKYDVHVEAGPSFGTKREEARQSMIAFMQALPQSATLIADLYAKNNDWPGAEEIAKRLRKVLPPGIAEPEEGDPPPAPPQPQPEMVLAQAEMEKARVAGQRAQMEAQVKLAELELKFHELALEGIRTVQDGAKIDLQEFETRSKLRLDAAKLAVSPAQVQGRKAAP